MSSAPGDERFSLSRGEAPSEESILFVDFKDVPVREPVPGYRVRFVHSGNMTIAHWEIEAGSEMPEHSHAHEQVVNIVEGEFELLIAGEPRTIMPGTVVVIAPYVSHSGRALTFCRMIDAFYPVREDYR
jgi:quercetin dioxygenase-like cupin family protein